MLKLPLGIVLKSDNKLELKCEQTVATGSGSSAEYMNEELALMLKVTRKRF
jgi:hypothetical protein